MGIGSAAEEEQIFYTNGLNISHASQRRSDSVSTAFLTLSPLHIGLKFQRKIIAVEKRPQGLQYTYNATLKRQSLWYCRQYPAIEKWQRREREDREPLFVDKFLTDLQKSARMHFVSRSYARHMPTDKPV